MSDRRQRERRSRSRSPVTAKKEPAENEQKDPVKEQQPPPAEKEKQFFAIDREKVSVVRIK